LLPHHAAALDPPQQNRITGDSGLQPTSSTKSAHSGHSSIFEIVMEPFRLMSLEPLG
jgi:hypothetical protein